MAVELVDPRRALEVVPRNLSLPCRDRWLELVLIGVTFSVPPPLIGGDWRGGPTPPPRRAQPLLLLSRSNPPTEGGGVNLTFDTASQR